MNAELRTPHPCGILSGTDELYHCRPILSKTFPALDWPAQLITHIIKRILKHLGL